MSSRSRSCAAAGRQELVNGRALRWLTGFRYDANHFANAPNEPPPLSLPPDRTLVYPWVGIASLEDQFVTTANLNKIGRTEDLDFGTSYTLQLGRGIQSSRLGP